MLSVSDAEKLVHAFMTSKLDDCNALLGGCPASSINKLQIVQNAAARVLTRSRKYDHITPILQSLHWLPIKFRISYKILLLTYKALNDLAPAYLTNLLSRYKRDLHTVVTRDFTSFCLDPENMRRYDTNPSGDLRWCQPSKNRTTKFCLKYLHQLYIVITDKLLLNIL